MTRGNANKLIGAVAAALTLTAFAVDSASAQYRTRYERTRYSSSACYGGGYSHVRYVRVYAPPPPPPPPVRYVRYEQVMRHDSCCRCDRCYPRTVYVDRSPRPGFSLSFSYRNDSHRSRHHDSDHRWNRGHDGRHSHNRQHHRR